MRLRLLLLSSALALVGAGCAVPSADPSSRVLPLGEPAAAPAPVRLQLENTAMTQPGDVTLRFALRSAKGLELSPQDLELVHERRLHFLLTRDDLTGFQHLHPEFVDGAWQVATAIPAAGEYRLYADFSSRDAGPEVLHATLLVGGLIEEPRPPVPTPDRSASAADVTATLQSPVELRAGEQAVLSFALTVDGRAATRISRYLGAYGHVVILREDEPQTFVHVHPVDGAAPSDGVVRFATNFPSAGRYVLFAQFDADGMVRTFPIAVDVAAATAAKPGTPAPSVHHGH
jgi:hypothetical protein